jgi:hypothetical protein
VALIGATVQQQIGNPAAYFLEKTAINRKDYGCADACALMPVGKVLRHMSMLCYSVEWVTKAANLSDEGPTRWQQRCNGTIRFGGNGRPPS